MLGMCGRYTNTLSSGELEEQFHTRIASDLGSRRYNIAPTEQILAVVRGRDGGPQARILSWGLVPWWSKDAKGAARMINARSETASRKPAFRDLVGSADCRALVIADGWYEWLRPEDPRQPRQPFRFTVDDGGPFAFAGLWTRATIAGERLETATILTVDATSNRVAAPIHDRMPAVLADGDSERVWLSEDLDAAGALALCRTLPSERLHAAPANPRVNRSGLDDEGPDLLVAPLAA
jgi:putative SOS response-associated peptidase YedK